MTDTITSKPKLHAGGTAAWDASDAFLTWLEPTLRPGLRTLETGAGRSTLAFARAGCIHAAVTPSAAEIAAIEAEADARGISLANVTFHHGFSENILPYLPVDEAIDVVFIDGGHGFPTPAVDFQFLAPRLEVGGLLVIDDVDLWTGDMIVQVLKRDPAWRLEQTLKGRTAVLRKLAPFVPHEWTQQAYVRRKSFWPQTRRKLANGLQLVATGQFRALSDKLRSERSLRTAALHDR